MSASLVGSEMCIRDRRALCSRAHGSSLTSRGSIANRDLLRLIAAFAFCCLLYTSDAADVCSV
eukprot:10840548-Alexandrium_andersonii.AAC.1